MTELGGLGCRSGSLASLRGRWCIVIVIPKLVSSGRAISTCRPVLHVCDHAAAAPAAPRPTPEHSPSRGGLSYGSSSHLRHPPHPHSKHQHRHGAPLLPLPVPHCSRILNQWPQQPNFASGIALCWAIRPSPKRTFLTWVASED